ncbi:Hydrolase-4 domain-containing protein [Mycena chlorophos]|uniref:Hydrolase-4 domain-containing protein n=1 Tax=Mycena chlorophos TaxID=658473 RepID=A0A8H6WPG1_MYCCL|nr:Hydrolase-4 domain-containing protein [Mycena chlorophos]
MVSRVVAYPIALLSFMLAFLSVYRGYYPPRGAEHEVQHNYTYVGDDFPELWDIGAAEKVAMIVEESRWYPIDGGRDTVELWSTTSPVGLSYVRLGPEFRTFAVSMFHDMHCLRFMRVIIDGRYDEDSQEHMHHCLNYLRQSILCSPDLTLEPADVLDRDFEVDRVGSAHVCSDWTVMYEEAEANFNRWSMSKGSIPTPD